MTTRFVALPWRCEIRQSRFVWVVDRRWCGWSDMVEGSRVRARERVKAITRRIVNIRPIRGMVRGVLLGNMVLWVVMAVALSAITEASCIHCP